jgi:chitodextrinase
VKASDWEYLFPMRAASYTYSNFLKAVGKFPAV